MGDILDSADLAPFGVTSTDLAQAIIKHVENLALMAAPCLKDKLTDPQVKSDAASILIGAALRWATNPKQFDGMEAAGPFTVTTKPKTWVLYDREIASLKALCGGPATPTPGLPQGQFPAPPPQLDSLFSGLGFRHCARGW